MGAYVVDGVGHLVVVAVVGWCAYVLVDGVVVVGHRFVVVVMVAYRVVGCVDVVGGVDLGLDLGSCCCGGMGVVGMGRLVGIGVVAQPIAFAIVARGVALVDGLQSNNRGDVLQ